MCAKRSGFVGFVGVTRANASTTYLPIATSTSHLDYCLCSSLISLALLSAFFLHTTSLYAHPRSKHTSQTNNMTTNPPSLPTTMMANMTTNRTSGAPSSEAYTFKAGKPMQLIIGHERNPGGRVVLTVSEPHMRNLSARWAELVARQKSKCRLQPSGTKKIRLREEDGRTMCIYMSIAHLQFQQLPDHLDFPEIVRLAEAAERFDMHHLLAAHIGRWVSPYRSKLMHKGYEEWLFVAYHFGYEDEYLNLAKYLAMNCRIGEGGVLLAPGKDDALTGLFPSRALGLLF
jgi:hypothetical protein